MTDLYTVAARVVFLLMGLALWVDALMMVLIASNPQTHTVVAAMAWATCWLLVCAGAAISYFSMSRWM